MKTSILHRRIGALLALAFLAAAGPAAATSYVMMSDEVLADDAPIVAEAHVVAVDYSPASGTPSTDYLVEIERMLKGYTSGSTIVVRVEGGVRPDGLGLRIYGAPQFREGERALLFLKEHADGTYGVYQMMLGAFHEVTAGGRRLAMRDLGAATEVMRQPDGSLALAQGADRPRDLERFATWLQDRERGLSRPADYLTALDPKAMQQVTQEFTFITDPGTNLPLRWNLFDSGGSVTFRAFSTPQPAVPDAFGAFQTGLNAWTSDPDTPIRYLYGGTTSANGGLNNFDNVNSILFNDPNSEIDAFRCTGANGGGVLAKGGPWYDSSDRIVFHGTTYIRTQGADIVVNNGIDCFFQRSRNAQKAAEELFAHELGHTLGLGHTSEDTGETDFVKRDALMFAFVHDDGRGARLTNDDRAGIRRLYQLSGGGSVSGKCTPNTTTLCLKNKRFRVEVDWQNQFNGTSGQGRAIPRTDLTGFFSFGDPKNIELLVKVLDFGDVIKVFYGELTNLHFTITVTDVSTGEAKTYQNTPGDCGGIDQNAFSSAQAAAAASRTAGAKAARAKAGSCRGDRDTLCLLGGRFAVEVDWRNPGNNTSGRGGASSLSDVTGTFFFTDPSNVELVVKMLNFGDRIAVFYGTLSNLEYTIHVTDTVTNTTKTYNNPNGTFCGGLDNNAF
jgi:matrixin